MFGIIFLVSLDITLAITSGEESAFQCAMTICNRGKADLSPLHCQSGTMLIKEVTDVMTGESNALAFKNMRRMCMGKPDCPTRKFCEQSGSNLHVVYHCIQDTNISCEEKQHVVNATQGVVRNLAYPSTDTSDCSVRVKVPDDSYINIIIHDMERLAANPECDGGLHLRTSRMCNFDETFPHKTLCSFSGNTTVIQACGDVDISMTPSKAGFRFYISFIVTPIGETPKDNYLDPISNQCPPGASIDKTVGSFPIDSYPDSPHDKHHVFYVALIVAALSLTGLIVITTICIRRQHQLKYGGGIDIASLISGRSPSLDMAALRPLPLISSSTSSRRHSYPSNVHARLEEGYSIVADEIPYFGPSDELRSPAYAEVEDNIAASLSERSSERFPFGLPGTNLLTTERKSVENVYSDLNDRNVYHEISDDLIRTENVYVPSQIPPMTLSIFTGKRNINKAKNKSLQSIGKQDSEETYILCQTPEREVSPSMESKKSESDGSLNTEENDSYEIYQSVDV
ncbi:uncharacterized protein LOC125665990 isoform X2 [Ostrea edulis]|uniref:uncharacterized protein LOC125665990 isoform X2 n=1 Tax=Ostrea edulis TaxID=37623 RepID=UPI00209566A9|nr:uncharacterized protein LOC125665990 isoform X2 [Ostrea edulis]